MTTKNITNAYKLLNGLTKTCLVVIDIENSVQAAIFGNIKQTKESHQNNGIKEGKLLIEFFNRNIFLKLTIC